MWSCNWLHMGVGPTEQPADWGDAANTQYEQPWVCYYHAAPTQQIKVFFVIWSRKMFLKSSSILFTLEECIIMSLLLITPGRTYYLVQIQHKCYYFIMCQEIPNNWNKWNCDITLCNCEFIKEYFAVYYISRTAKILRCFAFLIFFISLKWSHYCSLYMLICLSKHYIKV